MIYAIDFDGTLSWGQYPECGKPNMKLIDFLKKKKKDGNKLILWTMREGKPLENAVEWCKQYGLEFDAVNDNLQEMKDKYQNNPRKIFCDYYIDDNHFTSEFLVRKTAIQTESKRARII